MVIFETPTNPFLKTISIRQVADYLNVLNNNAILVVDNTWATPLFQKPLQQGADISLHSATKYFSGHSDVMGGCIALSDPVIYDQLRTLRFYQGNILAPHSAWLLRRSMQTLEIRLKQQSKTTLKVKAFLENHELVEKVFYPLVDGEQLLDYGALIFFSLKKEYIDSYQNLTENLKLFSTGTGMACVSSMIALPYTGSHSSMNEDEKKNMGLDKTLVRLSIGLEAANDLMADLKTGFSAIMR